MSTWKETPHLFANKKFRIKLKGGEGKSIPFNGYFEGKIVRTFESDTDNDKSLNSIYMNLSEHELLARRVEDMTYQELKAVPSHENWPATIDAMRNSINQDIYHKRIIALDFLYLLSIGVYPFDREDFKGGDMVPMTKD